MVKLAQVPGQVGRREGSITGGEDSITVEVIRVRDVAVMVVVAVTNVVEVICACAQESESDSSATRKRWRHFN